MKVRHSVPIPRAVVSSALAIAVAMTFSVAVPQEAAAAKKAKTITRAKVISRANAWVQRKVPYSQRRYHAGYRQDCSGFVSMAWQLGRSYTTRSLPSVSKRVSRGQAKIGDAVLTPGHVVIFGGWKNRRTGEFYAYEEPRSGKVATKRVRKMKGNAKILRRVGIRDKAVQRVASRAPVTVPKVPLAPPEVSVAIGDTIDSAAVPTLHTEGAD